MPEKPSILFVAVTPPEYAPTNVNLYWIERRFHLHPHKHSVLALVAWLREHGCEGNYVWVNPGDPDGPAIIERAIRKHNPTAVGFSFATEELLSHYKVIRFIKEHHPDLPVIAGGHHVSAEPVHTLENFPDIDYVCIGEGEKTLTEWLKLIAAGADLKRMRDVKGLAYRDASYGIVQTAPREKFTDINVLPDPAWDLIASPDDPSNKTAVFPITSSYGCRYFCTFCAADHGNYRFVKPERMVDQIQHAQEKFGVDYFAIRDSFWPPSSEWLNRFCDLVEARGLKFNFHFETRAGVLNRGQLERLKIIGLQAVAVGVESGDPGMLKAIKKGITLQMARETFKLLHEAGIFTIAFFMFGNQGENADTVEKTIDFMHELNPTLCSPATFRPFPGTEAYQYVREEDRYWWMGSGYPTICDFTIDELHHIREEANVWYPLRVKYLAGQVLSRNHTPRHRKTAWNIFKVHLKKVAIGLSEQSRMVRSLIHGAKKLIRGNSRTGVDFFPNGHGKIVSDQD